MKHIFLGMMLFACMAASAQTIEDGGKKKKKKANVECQKDKCGTKKCDPKCCDLKPCPKEDKSTSATDNKVS